MKKRNVLLMSDDSSDEPDDEVTEIKRAMVKHILKELIIGAFDVGCVNVRGKQRQGRNL